MNRRTTSSGAAPFSASRAPGAQGVFLDTGIFIAFLVSKDRHYRSALALFGGPRPRWFTSALICGETYAWLLHRRGEETARQFRFLLESLDELVVLDTDPELRAETWRMLDRLRGARLTWVDASSLALMARHDIRTVWATDHHLGLTGAEVLPRS